MTERIIGKIGGRYSGTDQEIQVLADDANDETEELILECIQYEGIFEDVAMTFYLSRRQWEKMKRLGDSAFSHPLTK